MIDNKECTKEEWHKKCKEIGFSRDPADWWNQWNCPHIAIQRQFSDFEQKYVKLFIFFIIKFMFTTQYENKNCTNCDWCECCDNCICVKNAVIC